MSIQPILCPGDILLLCEHSWGLVKPHGTYGAHWWETRGAVTTKTPDGETVDVAFLICCTSCYLQADGDAERVTFKGLYEWDDGDRLIVKQVES